MTAHSHLNFREVIDRLVVSCKRRRDLRELAGLGEADFAAIARDLRLAPGDLEVMARNDGRWSANLGKLLDALDIDGADAMRTEPAVMRDMERVCAVCPAAARCGRDLRTGRARWTYREYCANRPTIEALEEFRLCQRRADG